MDIMGIFLNMDQRFRKRLPHIFPLRFHSLGVFYQSRKMSFHRICGGIDLFGNGLIGMG